MIRIIILFFILLIFLIFFKNKKDNFTNKISYDDVNFFQLDDKHYLFFDIFCRNNELIIICPAYNDLELKYDDIKILVNNKEVYIKSKHDFIQYEPSIIRIYDISDIKNEEISVDVIYNNFEKKYKLINKNLQKKYNFTMSTLFKDDDYLLDSWIDYYNNQGCEYYYMYVNNKINKEYKFKNCKFIEWDFHYWSDCKKVTANKGKNLKHHAQLGQINHCLYKYCKPLSNWSANIDLDEYMYVKDKKIGDILDDNYNFILFENYFSHLKDHKIPKEKINLYNEIIFTSLNSEGRGHRTKFIFKTDDNICSGIHNSKKMNSKKELNIDNKLIHFENWSYKRKKRRYKKDFKIINLEKSL